MASAERKAADEKIKEENLHNSLGAEEQQAETEAFQCAKCKQVRRCLIAVPSCFDVYFLTRRENAAIDRRKRGALMNP